LRPEEGRLVSLACVLPPSAESQQWSLGRVFPHPEGSPVRERCSVRRRGRQPRPSAAT
jgi:hypothetical protein